MMAKSPHPRLADIVEAIQLITSEMTDISLQDFGGDRRKRWIVERGLEIVSEASRRLPDEVKARQPGIPWPKIAGIGNILRHEYAGVSPKIMLDLVQHDLPSLLAACEAELAREEDGPAFP